MKDAEALSETWRLDVAGGELAIRPTFGATAHPFANTSDTARDAREQDGKPTGDNGRTWTRLPENQQ